MRLRFLVLGMLLWAGPAWATPITVTFSGTVTSASPLWSWWLEGFGVGAAIEGFISGDTEIPGEAVWSFNVAGYTGGAANTGGPTYVRPTGVTMNASGNAFISGTRVPVASYIAEMLLFPQSQTGYIVYSGIGADPNGVIQWDQTWEASINNVAVNVPEPATLWLSGIGLLALAARARRRFQQDAVSVHKHEAKPVAGRSID